VDGYLRGYMRKYFETPHKVKLLVLGDSHANAAWATSKDSAIYNFAHGSDNITDMSCKFSFLVARNKFKGRKAVVLPFDAHFISKYREQKNNNWINSLINNQYLPNYLVYSLPLLYDNTTEIDLKNYLFHRDRDKSNEVMRLNKKVINARLKGQFPNPDKSIELLNRYQRLIDQIRRDGYEIIPIKYPVHPYYDSLVHNYIHSANLNKEMDSLALANGLKIIDFSEIVESEELFSDQDHLNRTGSKFFIQKFYELFPSVK